MWLTALVLAPILLLSFLYLISLHTVVSYYEQKVLYLETKLKQKTIELNDLCLMQETMAALTEATQILSGKNRETNA